MKIILSAFVVFMGVFSSYAGTPGIGKPTQTSLSFRENKGQVTDQHKNIRKDIDFKLAVKGLSVFVGKAQLHYQFYRYDDQIAGTSQSARMADQPTTTPATGSTIAAYRMDVELVGADINAPFSTGEQVLDPEIYYGRYNMTVNGFKTITYKNIYPFIDWVIYIRNNQMKYDFVVHPGGKVSDIQLRYNGATSVDDQKGNVVAQTPMGIITEKAPYSYVKESGRETPSRFITEGNTVNFEVGNFQPQQTLVIDPELNWATYYGGENAEVGIFSSNTTDQEGNVYLSGWTGSLTNIATTGSFQEAPIKWEFGSTAFLAKFSPSGVRLWATFYGTFSETGKSVVCDKDNNVYMAGLAFGHDGLNDLSTPGSYQETGIGNTDVFLVKFNGTGVRQWATLYGGTGDLDEGANAQLAYDGVNNKLYLSASTQSFTNISTPGSFQEAHSGPTDQTQQDAFIVQFNTDGVRQWATYFGGTETTTLGDEIGVMACDANGDLYVMAYVKSPDVLSTPGSHQPDFLNGAPGVTTGVLLLTKFNTSGQRKWATYYGNDARGKGYGLTFDKKNNLYIAGQTSSATGIATAGAYQETINAGQRASFLAKFSSDGIRQWGTYFGGTGTATAVSVMCDSADHIFIAGTAGVQLTGTPGIYQELNAGSNDGFIARFTNTGKHIWTTLFGGESNEALSTANIVKSKHIMYVQGYTYSATGIATAGAHQTVKASEEGGPDAFVAEFKLDPPIEQPKITGTLDVCQDKTLVYSVAPVANAKSYTWTLPNGWTGTSVSNTITVKTGAASGTISVTANGTYDTSKVETALVNSSALPTAAITVNGVQFTATPGGMAGYQWLQNERPLPGATSANLTAPGNGLYKVIVTNNTGCSDTSDAYKLELNTNLYVPNTFSPNGDTKNDILKVFGNGLAAIQLMIFNQWGQKIYETSDLQRGWDGRAGGKTQPVGVYIYALKATLTTGEVITKKGSINLVR